MFFFCFLFWSFCFFNDSLCSISGDGDIAQVEALEGVLMVNEDQEVSILDGGNELPASSSSDVTD